MGPPITGSTVLLVLKYKVLQISVKGKGKHTHTCTHTTVNGNSKEINHHFLGDGPCGLLGGKDPSDRLLPEPLKRDKGICSESCVVSW